MRIEEKTVYITRFGEYPSEEAAKEGYLDACQYFLFVAMGEAPGMRHVEQVKLCEKMLPDLKALDAFEKFFRLD